MKEILIGLTMLGLSLFAWFVADRIGVTYIYGI